MKIKNLLRYLFDNGSLFPEIMYFFTVISLAVATFGALRENMFYLAGVCALCGLCLIAERIHLIILEIKDIMRKDIDEHSADAPKQ